MVGQAARTRTALSHVLPACSAVTILEAANIADSNDENYPYGGRGWQTGKLAPEFGPRYAELTCCACAATWTGLPGEGCWWCQQSHQRMLEHQAELVLRAPDVDPDDGTYEARMNAWGEQLERATQSGIVTAEQAGKTWERAVRVLAA